MKLNLPAGSSSALALLVGSLVFVGGATAFIVSKHSWASARLSELEPRYARLIGLESSSVALDKAVAERRAFVGRHAYLSSQDVARAGSDALQRARETFSKAGLEISSTQVLPAKEVDGFDRIPLVLRLEGELAALQGALVVLPTQAPSLFVEGFNVQVMGVPKADGPQRLSMQANLFVLRARK